MTGGQEEVVTRTATVADLLDVLLKCRIIEPKTDNYGPQVKLTDIGRALLATVGTPDEPVLGNTLVPGMLVDVPADAVMARAGILEAAGE